MRSLAGSLADGVLADAHFNSSSPTDTAHQYKVGKGSSKSMELGDVVGMAKHFSKMYRTSDEPSTTLYLQSKI